MNQTLAARIRAAYTVYQSHNGHWRLGRDVTADAPHIADMFRNWGYASKAEAEQALDKGIARVVADYR